MTKRIVAFVFIALVIGCTQQGVAPSNNLEVNESAAVVSPDFGPPLGQQIVVANFNDSSIRVWWRSATGNLPPAFTIVGPHTGFSNPIDLASDPTGNLYVEGRQQNIVEFPPSARGDASPSESISHPACANGNGGFYRLATDENGNLYVLVEAEAPPSCILVFAPGSIISNREIDDPGWRFPSGIAIGNGVLYIVDEQANAIEAYPEKSSGTVSPSMRIVGPKTRLSSPMRVGIDKNGGIYVQQQINSNVILAYDHPKSGDMAPTRTITAQSVNGFSTALTTGALTLAVVGTAPDYTPVVETYRDIASGGTPLHAISGNKTHLNNPKALLYR